VDKHDSRVVTVGYLGALISRQEYYSSRVTCIFYITYYTSVIENKISTYSDF